MSRKTRKSMLEGLMGVDPAAPAATALTTTAATTTTTAADRALGTPQPHGAARKGAVGAISSAITAMRANAVLDLDPRTIRAGGLADRLEDVPEDDAELRRSMAAHGQQVPVLVRPHPEEIGAWQIVYGRRRVLAARDLGISVRALVRELDDDALVMAQGQENAVRRDLSFIEKARFASQMEAAGYPRAAICDALAIDKTLVSRLLSLIERIPEQVLAATGAAHGVGRPRWFELADLLEASPTDPAELVEWLALAHPDASSADRFAALVRFLKRQAPRTLHELTETTDILGLDGVQIAQVRRSGRKVTLTLDAGDGFEGWLLDRLPGLHASWRETEG
jgi:ParB family chromosome partitioning protein